MLPHTVRRPGRGGIDDSGQASNSRSSGKSAHVWERGYHKEIKKRMHVCKVPESRAWSSLHKPCHPPPILRKLKAFSIHTTTCPASLSSFSVLLYTTYLGTYTNTIKERGYKKRSRARGAAVRPDRPRSGLSAGCVWGA